METKSSKQAQRQKNKTTDFSNFLSSVPEKTDDEIFQKIVQSKHVKIERIISYGQSPPATGWYDQENSEWVMVLEGEAIISFEDGRETHLGKNDFLMIIPHQKHRVKWTSPGQKTIWLAVHF